MLVDKALHKTCQCVERGEEIKKFDDDVPDNLFPCRILSRHTSYLHCLLTLKQIGIMR